MARAIAFSLVWLATAGILALFLNLTGDCGPNASGCGETQRQISFVVLAGGAAAAIYTVGRSLLDRAKH